MSADWLPVREALARVLADAARLEPLEVGLADALGHVLAEEIRSPLDFPSWDNSAMDGFAVRAVDVAGATAAQPRTLRVTDDVAAGAFPARPLEPGTAARVMTGAPVPAGADGVIRVEHTDGGSGLGTGDARVRIDSDADAGRNVRRRAEELCAGDTVLTPGTVVHAAAVGVAASVGRARLRVVRRPSVAVLTSGDELVDLDRFDEVLAGRKIVSSNGYTLAAQLAEAGARVRMLGIARDTRASIAELLEGARGCDALVTSAGISMGEHDLMRVVLAEAGLRASFWRVRMRPGSPFGYGRVEGLGGIPWFGLPGNPVSSMVTFEILVRPALLRMAGHARVFHPAVPVRMGGGYAAAAGLTHFVRVRLEPGPDGVDLATPTGPQGSGMLTSMAAADALVVVPETRAGLAAGEDAVALRLGAAPPAAEPSF